jgi:hypothetical protein
VGLDWTIDPKNGRNLVSILSNSVSAENFCGQIFIPKFWTKFHPKTTDKVYPTIIDNNHGA